MDQARLAKQVSKHLTYGNKDFFGHSLYVRLP